MRYYGKISLDANAVVTLHNDQKSFERTINDDSAVITGDATTVGSAGVGTSGVGDGGTVVDAYDFEYGIRCLRTGSRFQHSGTCSGEGFFFQIDGFTMDIQPHRHSPVSAH